MTRPSSKDRFPKWKRKWWATSQSWHEVALGSITRSPGATEGKECSVGKRRGDGSGVKDILRQGHLEHWGKVGG